MGVGDSVSAADVPVRKEAADVWLASAKAVSMKGVAGVSVGEDGPDPPVELGVSLDTSTLTVVGELVEV